MKKTVILVYRTKQMVCLRKSRERLGLLVKQAYSPGLTVAGLLLAGSAVHLAALLKVPSPPPSAEAPPQKTAHSDVKQPVSPFCSAKRFDGFSPGMC
jgi:hypothetical protein